MYCEAIIKAGILSKVSSIKPAKTVSSSYISKSHYAVVHKENKSRRVGGNTFVTLFNELSVV